MIAFRLAVVELYQKQLLFAKLGKMGGGILVFGIWHRHSNITVAPFKEDYLTSRHVSDGDIYTSPDYDAIECHSVSQLYPAM